MQYRTLIAAIALGAIAQLAPAQTIDPQRLALARQIVDITRPAAAITTSMVEGPAQRAHDQAHVKLQGLVEPARHDALMKAIDTDIAAYLSDALPLASDISKKSESAVYVPMLAERFSVEELQALLNWLKSPVRAKFEKASPEMQRALGMRIEQDARSQIEPKVRALSESVGTKIRSAVAP